MNIVLIGRMASARARDIHERLAPHENHGITAIPDVARLDEFAAQLRAADVLVGWPLTTAIVARCPNLKLIQASGAGIDGLDLSALPAGIQVANTFHHEAAIAEWVMLAMLTLVRQPYQYDRRLRQGDWWGSCIWGEMPVLAELAGRSVLVIGLGHIARELARRARAFDMRLIGVSRNPARPRGDFDEITGWDRWRDRLPEADFIVPCCPLTPETENLIGAPEIARLKHTAFLINMTRGRVFDEEAVFNALRDRRIAGAAIDVWYQYPSSPGESRLPSRFPYHELDNVLLSPHNSAWTTSTIMSRVDDIAENINRLADGRPLLHRLR